MTIDEAIKRQYLILSQGGHRLDKEDKQAIRIGIEATERLQDSRVQRLADFIDLLPSETKD